MPADAELIFCPAEGEREFWDAPFGPDCCLIFGKESVGLPPALRVRYRDRVYRIPHSKEIRSLNLSTAAGVALYEAIRRTGGIPGSATAGRGPRSADGGP